MHLQQSIQPAPHRRRIGCGHGDEIMIFGKTADRTVVKNHSVFTQHDCITQPPGLNILDIVTVNPGQKSNRIWSLYIDFTQGRHIHTADRIAYGKNLAAHSIGH